MKIAHVCPFYEPAIGGVKQVVQELAERQVKKGHEVHIYTSDWDKEKRINKKYEIINNIHVHRCYHIVRIANFATIWPSVFLKLINEKPRFDVIHSHVFGHLHFVLSAFASRIINAKHIHTTHCPWTDAFRSLSGRIGIFLSYNICSRISNKLTDKIIAITPWEKQFIKKYGAKEKQIKVIPNGMSHLFFKKIKNNDFRKKYNIPKNKKIILFFGRLNITKGPEKFVEIAQSILKQRKDMVFVIVGPDEGMKSIVKQKIKDNNIILLEPIRNRKDVVKMYQSSEVYVMPSFREGLPLTLFEAMASGLPIVASPVNGIPFEIKDGRNGFLVKYGDNKKFMEKILKIIDNRKIREKIIKNNIKESRQYDWDKITEKTLNVYGA